MAISTKKTNWIHILYILLLLSLLITARWAWFNQISVVNPPTIQQGVLDLRDKDLDSMPPITLDGEWSFYPEQWVDETNVESALDEQFLQLPKEQLHQYGTYYLKILLASPLSKPIGLRFQSINSASQVEINGNVVANVGTIAEQSEDYVPENKSFLVTYEQNDISELHLFVKVANHTNFLKGGIVKSPQFGTQEKVHRIYVSSIIFQLIICIIFLLHAVYAFIIYLMNLRKTEFITFIMLMITGAMTIAFMYDELFFRAVPVDIEWTIKLKALAPMWFSFFLLLMGRVLTGVKRNGFIFKGYTFLLIVLTVFTVWGSMVGVNYLLNKGIHLYFYAIPLLLTAYYFIKMFFYQREGAWILLFSSLCIINNIAWMPLYYTGTAQFIFYPVDLLATIISFSTYWFKRYFHQSNENELLNAKLAEANEVKDRFLANTSHELRTPLHGIMNITQSVLNRKRDVLDQQSQHDMELIMMISRRMSVMLNDLLDVVRLQDKRITLQKTSVQIQSVASGVMDMLRFLTDDRKQVELRINIEEKLPHVCADEERLVQILINLVHNAMKYTEKGSVELSAEQENGHVWIHVKDTGVGMDEATQQRLFIPYEQGSLSDNGGIGLGLSICKDLIELHGSTLIFRSKLGKGSTFSFQLPVWNKRTKPSPVQSIQLKKASNLIQKTTEQMTRETAVMAEAEDIVREFSHLSATVSEKNRIRILAVDDDPVNLKVLVNILASESYDIVSTYSAQEAMDKIQQERWDLMIADVMMPGMSGYELTKNIRKRFTLYELPIILLTARSEPEDIYAGFLAGANDYVTKPVDALELKYRAWSLSSLKQAVQDRLGLEAAYLQAQIQPHFLFNTLNSILALSDIDPEKMKNLAEAFTSYLRISFDFWTMSRTVPLARELELVENYLYIEQQRFAERLQVEWEINIDVNIMIPPLTIQPLVENAVRHGLLKLTKGGVLRIRIHPKDDRVKIIVEDTGIGMSEERIHSIFHSAAMQEEKHGIALFNTHSRLVRMYGEGLNIESKVGEGTKVFFFIPHSSHPEKVL